MRRIRLQHDDLIVLGRLFTYVLSVIGAFATLVPGKHTGYEWIQHVGLTLIVLFVLFLSGVEVRLWWRRREKVFPLKDPEIASYLRAWLERGGNAAIFSRDLSWAQGGENESLLSKKAAANELVLCLPRSTELSERLRSAGAHVFTYESLRYDPQSRFTIINFGRGGARVTAGAAIGGEHVVREYEANEDPFYWIAQDLISIVREMSRLGGTAA